MQEFQLNPKYCAIGFVVLLIFLYFVKIDDKDINVDEADELEKKKETTEKFLGLDAKTWGWISVATNGLSVFFQLSNLFKTRTAKSFSMSFISLMTILNAVYCIVGLLTLNWGLAIATFFFVVYNLTVVYFYYYGVQTVKGFNK